MRNETQRVQNAKCKMKTEKTEERRTKVKTGVAPLVARFTVCVTPSSVLPLKGAIVAGDGERRLPPIFLSRGRKQRKTRRLMIDDCRMTIDEWKEPAAPLDRLSSSSEASPELSDVGGRSEGSASNEGLETTPHAVACHPACPDFPGELVSGPTEMPKRVRHDNACWRIIPPEG
jgi:hypothetical protein